MPHKECRTCKFVLQKGGIWRCAVNIEKVVSTTPFNICNRYKFWGEIKLKSQR